VVGRRCARAPSRLRITLLGAVFTLGLAIAIKYLGNRRDAFYPDVGNSSQTRGTVGILYTFLGHERFGAVSWR
jgi:hypothetical protein